MSSNKVEIYNYFTKIYPYHTYQRLIKSSEYHAKEVYAGSRYYSAANDCFLYLHEKNVGLDTKLYSKHKININIADMRHLVDAWNTIVPILTADDSIVMQCKVVVPEWVELFYAQGQMEKIYRDRRMSGAQIILYIYYKSGEELVIDYDAYIKCLRSIERAFTLTQVTPPESSFVLDYDVKIGKYFSIREDIADLSGNLSSNHHKETIASPIIEEFKKRLMPQPTHRLFSTSVLSIDAEMHEERKEDAERSDYSPTS